MWQVVEGLAAGGVTVFLTTQYLEEAERLAETIAVLDGGRVIAHGVAAALGVLLFFVAAVSWLAAAFGLLVRVPEAANSGAFFLMFFCYASSAFVPVRTMPTWLRGFAEHQPATPVTETIRGLLRASANPGAVPLGSALAWCAGLMVVSVALSAILFRRRTAA